MKNRKRIVVAFLLVAVMLLGVGFAAITGQLTITGNLTTGVQPFDVVFTQVALNIEEATTTDNVHPAVTIEKTAAADDSVTPIKNSAGEAGLPSVSFTATGLAQVGDKLELTFTIKNRNNVKMYVTPTMETNTLTVFDVKSDWSGTTKEIGAADSGSDTITYKLTITLKNEIDSEIAESFTIKLSGSSTAPQTD